MVDGVTAAGSEFNVWASKWMCLAEFSGRTVPDVEERIAAIVTLWHEPIPGDGRWKRGPDPRLRTPDRYLRGKRNENHTPRGEHEIEHQILVPQPGEPEAVCLGARLIDGVNALPLAKDASGGRNGNVEADMLLLVRAERKYQRLLVEVKAKSNNAWYGVVENLRQLKLFRESEEAQGLFQVRCKELALPASLPVAAVTLAPRDFYSARGAKGNSVAPAQELLVTMWAECGVEALLATWDPSQRVIEVL